MIEPTAQAHHAESYWVVEGAVGLFHLWQFLNAAEHLLLFGVEVPVLRGHPAVFAHLTYGHRAGHLQLHNAVEVIAHWQPHDVGVHNQRVEGPPQGDGDEDEGEREPDGRLAPE